MKLVWGKLDCSKYLNLLNRSQGGNNLCEAPTAKSKIWECSLIFGRLHICTVLYFSVCAAALLFQITAGKTIGNITQFDVNECKVAVMYNLETREVFRLSAVPFCMLSLISMIPRNIFRRFVLWFYFYLHQQWIVIK